MDNSILNTIKELISFYVKTNYETYLKDNNIEKIPESNIRNIVIQLYSERKDHLKSFIKNSLQELYKENYPGDIVINNILFDIFNDDKLAINKLIIEIKKYQEI
tara:strand:+ start:1894 stop:2205 length:312 start_codon:yes stop_codon:yes gene_type:complete